MSIIRIALLGKSLSHSDIAKKLQSLTGNQIEFRLIDIRNEKQLPSLSDLALVYNGVLLAAPFQKNYLKVANLHTSPEVLHSGSMNCLSFRPGKYVAGNTEYLAAKDFLSKLPQDKLNHVILLGEGSQTEIIKKVAQELNLKLDQYARVIDGEILKQKIVTAPIENVRYLIVNASARDFQFIGELPHACWLWDLHVSAKDNSHTLPNKCESYVDGRSLQEAQALLTLQFWGLK